MKPISQHLTAQILSLLDQGLSLRQTASTTGVHYSTVSRLCQEHCPTLQKLSAGRPSKLTPTALRHATRFISSGKANTAVNIAKTLQRTYSGSVSVETVRRGLKKTGFKAVAKLKRPLLSKT